MGKYPWEVVTWVNYRSVYFYELLLGLGGRKKDTGKGKWKEEGKGEEGREKWEKEREKWEEEREKGQEGREKRERKNQNKQKKTVLEMLKKTQGDL